MGIRSDRPHSALTEPEPYRTRPAINLTDIVYDGPLVPVREFITPEFNGSGVGDISRRGLVGGGRWLLWLVMVLVLVVSTL
jgi:hypothetical protein